MVGSKEKKSVLHIIACFMMLLLHEFMNEERNFGMTKTIVTNNNFECLIYDYLLYFIVYVTDLLFLPLFLI